MKFFQIFTALRPRSKTFSAARQAASERFCPASLRRKHLEKFHHETIFETGSKNNFLGRVTAILLFVVIPAKALEIRGVTFPDRLEVSGKKLLLNGVGLRSATIFKIGVYAAGLYMPEREQSAEKILASTSQKLIKMQFLRDVGAKKIRDAWDQSFTSNCEVGCAESKKKLETLKGKFPDVKKGDVMTCLFDGKSIKVAINERPVASVDGEQFAATMLANWLGKNPPNEELKEGLLGKTPK